jgi:ribosomal protein S18 acetylase RimI-like enzyme
VTRLTFGEKPTVIRCGRCGRFADWEESRLQVVCGCRPLIDVSPVLVREASAAERQNVMELFNRDFGHRKMVAFGEIVSLEGAAALVAENTGGEVAGALAWRPHGDALHIVALATDPTWQRAGVGGQLVTEVEAIARRQSQPTVIATITNDNLPALYFYQRRGYRLSAVLSDAVARHSADHIVIGFAGIPVRDELQLTKELQAP